MQFQEVVGQEATKQKLQQMLQENRVPHALMLAGPNGSGTLPLALAFASALLTRPAQGLAVGGGSAEAMVRELSHPDLHFVFPVFRPKGTPSQRAITSDDFIAQWREQCLESPYFSMEQWRERIGIENQQMQIFAAEADEIVRKLNLTTSQAGWRVLLLWLPELLHTAAANKLLKIIEEPPALTCIILVSENPERVLGTICSRTQRLDVPPLTEDDLTRALMEGSGLEADDARQVARRAAGSLAAARSLVAVGTAEQRYLDLFAMLMRKAYARDIAQLRQWSLRMAEMGREDQRAFLDFSQRFLRENFIYNLGDAKLNYLMPHEEQFATRFARFIGAHNVVQLYELFSEADRDVAQNTYEKMVYFDLALRCILLLQKP